MKTIKLMVTALCVTACIATTAFAEDDFGIEAASPEMASDPVNPQPGMKADAYNFKYISPKQYRQMTSSLDALRKMWVYDKKVTWAGEVAHAAVRAAALSVERSRQ